MVEKSLNAKWSGFQMPFEYRTNVLVQYFQFINAWINHFVQSWINSKVDSNHEITTKNKRYKKFLPHQDLNPGPLKPKACGLPMSYTDPLLINSLWYIFQDPWAQPDSTWTWTPSIWPRRKWLSLQLLQLSQLQKKELSSFQKKLFPKKNRRLKAGKHSLYTKKQWNCKLFEMAAMPFPCNDTLVVLGNLPRIFPVSSLIYANFLIPNFSL